MAAKLTKPLSNRESGFTFDAESPTVGEWLDHWLEDCLRPLTKASKMVHSTFVRYEGIANNHLTMDRYSHLLENIGGEAVEGLVEFFG